MPKAQLTSDILSYVLHFVLSSRDLAAFSLASKAFNKVAYPELTYRSGRCDLENNTMWERFVSKPGLAARVREVTIKRGYRSDHLKRVKSTARQAMLQSELLLMQALKNMANLECFTWDRGLHAPLIRQREESQPWLTASEGSDATYEEDIWTVLRDYTPLRRLKVIELGFDETYLKCDTDPLTFNSTLFTLKNLTHVDLQLPNTGQEDYYNQGRPDENAAVRVKPLRDFLFQCPELQTLAIHFTAFNSSDLPFEEALTNLTSIFSDADWPRLESLTLRNVSIEELTMAKFLQKHTNLRKLSVSANLSEEYSGEILFNFQRDSCHTVLQGSLPQIDSLDLPPSSLRTILRGMGPSASLRSVTSLEPCDWCADDWEQEDGDIYTWTASDPFLWASPTEFGPTGSPNLLLQLANLTYLQVEGVCTFYHFRELIKSTPNLEHIVIPDLELPTYTSEDTYEEVLLYVSHWPRLVAYEGTRLWPSWQLEELQRDSERARSLARKIVSACSNLRELLWQGDGSPVKLVQADDGSVAIEADADFEYINRSCKAWGSKGKDWDLITSFA